MRRGGHGRALGLRLGVVGLGLASLLACSSRPQSGEGRFRRLPLVADAALTPAYASPARLRYHPRERARALAERVLSDGRRLLVGERGERWVFDPGAGGLAAGAMLAPEPLIAGLSDGQTHWFIGASGTSYSARGPLDAFERSSAPVEALSGVSAAGSTVIGIRQQQSLLRSADFGVTWSQVGPEPVSFVDVALEASGTGLALAVPEAVYLTQDFGESWAPIATPTIGALELTVALDGGIHALTPLGERRWNAAASRFDAPVGSAEASKFPSPPRGPDAGALAEGRAVLSGTHYLELARAPGQEGWQLLRGPFDGRLEVLPVPRAADCKAVRLASFQTFVTFACFRGGAEATTQPVELWQSRDLGMTFERMPGRLEASLASFRFAVGADGRWIASGVCPPGNVGSGCTPSGVQVARERGVPNRASTLGKQGVPSAGAPSATPSLADVALFVGFAADGRSAYAVGRRTKTGRFALFVSRDGGKSFEPEDLDLGQLASEEENDDFVERSPGTRVEWLSAAEDGAVALSFVHYGKRTLVVTDDRGKLLSTATPPEERALLSASGLRALAVAPKARQIWESLDGGVTWDPAQVLPIDLCPGDEACDVPVRCSPHACVIGHEFTRIGWGRREQDDSALLLPPLRPLRGPTDRSLRTPIACTLEQAPFRALPGVFAAPSAHDAAIGAADWYAVAEDPNRASVTVYHARGGKLDAVRLLEPVPRPEEYAYSVLDQIEGIAAVRFRVPEAVPGKTKLTDVEVAWDDVLNGRVGRARLADGGEHVPGDYVVGRGRARRAEPDLVSIAEKGLYLRLHARSPGQPTLYFDGKGVESLPPVVWPRDERFPARGEMVHADGIHSPILLVGRGAAVVRARLEGGKWAYDSFSTGMIDPAAFGLAQLQSIAYVSGRAGLHLEVQDGMGSISRAAIFPFRATGAVVDAPVAVATQRTLGERPAACDAEQKKSTPRVVAAVQPGTRHPVVVTDAALGPRSLVTGFAVLHGTERDPCAVAFEALSVATEGAPPSRESALILLDDLEHSVLFRVAGEREMARIEHRHMSCRFDPTLEVPLEIRRTTGAGEN